MLMLFSGGVAKETRSHAETTTDNQVLACKFGLNYVLSLAKTMFYLWTKPFMSSLLAAVELFRKNSLELMQLSGVNTVDLISFINTVSVGFLLQYYRLKRDGHYWTTRKNRLELKELSIVNKVSVV